MTGAAPGVIESSLRRRPAPGAGDRRRRGRRLRLRRRRAAGRGSATSSSSTTPPTACSTPSAPAASETTIGRNAEGEPNRGHDPPGRGDDLPRDLRRATTSAASRARPRRGRPGDAVGVRLRRPGRLETVKRDGVRGRAPTSTTPTATGSRSRAGRRRVDVDLRRPGPAADLRRRRPTPTPPRASCGRRPVGGATTTYDYDATGALTGVTLAGRHAARLRGRRRRPARGRDRRRVAAPLPLRPRARPGGGARRHRHGVKSRFIYATRSNVPDLMVRGGKTYRIVTDQLGSPVAVVDVATGAASSRSSTTTSSAACTRDTNPEFQPFGFAGGLYDRETGLVRFGARDYDPETGRFTAPDPAGFAGGSTNLYGYALNDPVNLTDPSGQILRHDHRPRVHRLRPVPDRQVADERVRRVGHRRRRAGARHRRGVHPVRDRRRRRGAPGQRGHLPDRHAGRAPTSASPTTSTGG